MFNILQHLQYTVLHVRARSAVVSLDNSIKDFQAVYLYIEPDILLKSQNLTQLKWKMKESFLKKYVRRYWPYRPTLCVV